jgi:hypothetical protein
MNPPDPVLTRRPLLHSVVHFLATCVPYHNCRIFFGHGRSGARATLRSFANLGMCAAEKCLSLAYRWVQRLLGQDRSYCGLVLSDLRHFNDRAESQKGALRRCVSVYEAYLAQLLTFELQPQARNFMEQGVLHTMWRP